MTKFIDVEVSHDYAHVVFREPREGERVGSACVQDPNGDDVDVVLERTDDGEVIGIEVLNLADVTLDTAENIARDLGLSFPKATLQTARRESLTPA